MPTGFIKGYRGIVIGITIIYIVFFISLPLTGQTSGISDTIPIKEVIISGHVKNSLLPGFKSSAIDSSILTSYNSRSLSALLSGQSMLFIKSYGMGGTATPSFRGTGASQTLIEWNGISINSPMLGQSDLSILPASMIDNIRLYYGGASMALQSGGLGGAINLETKPIWNNRIGVNLSIGSGSFGEYTGSGKIMAGTSKFQSVTKYYFTSARNNFRYLNTESSATPVWQTRTNNQLSQKGLLQEFYFRNEGNTGSARVWYQSSARHLPPTMLTEDFIERQYDESLRVMLDDNFSAGSGKYFLTGAFLLDNMNYTNKLASIDSRNLAETYVMKASRESQLGEYSRLNITLNSEFSVVNSNNYSGNKARNTTSLTASFDRQYIDRFGFTLLIREILYRKSLLFPDFSAGIQYRLINEKEYFIKANITRNSRIPSMNDLFWSEVGNPLLKNEYAYSYESVFEMNQKISPSLNVNSDLTFFLNNINDLILWHPGNNAIWTPDNISKAKTQGFEYSTSVLYSSFNLTAKLKAGYSYTRATTVSSALSNDGSVGKQLIYVPVHQANATLNLSSGKIYASWITDFTGKRFTASDNSSFLPAYLINNIMAGIKLPLFHTISDFDFNIDNLFATRYQSIAHYPLPGRTYFIKITVQLIKPL